MPQNGFACWLKVLREAKFVNLSRVYSFQFSGAIYKQKTLALYGNHLASWSTKVTAVGALEVYWTDREKNKNRSHPSASWHETNMESNLSSHFFFFYFKLRVQKFTLKIQQFFSMICFGVNKITLQNLI